MAQQAYQIQLTQVGEDGSESLVFPFNTGKEVITGSVEIPEGDLELPATDPEEKLEKTIGTIKAYLNNLTNSAVVKRSVVDDPEDNSDNLPTTRATASLKAALDSLTTTVAKNKEDIETKAPIMHADAEKTYGGATSSLYGHTKLSDQYTGFSDESPVSAADDSIGASQKALADAYSALNTAKAPVSHASEDTTYGIGTSLKYGHAKLSDTYKVAVENGDAEHGVAASQKAVADAYAELTSVENGLAGKAQTMHADAGRTYGVGTNDLFGHLKISDDYNMENIETDGTAAAGMSASLFALYRSNAALQAVIDTKLAATHANEKATDSVYSHVKLTDEYTTNKGDASSSVGASSKALADAYAELSATLDATQKSIVTLNSGMVPESSKTTFNDDGSITVKTDTSTKTTVFNEDGSITDTVDTFDEGGLISTKIIQNTLFNEDGSIDKVVSMEAL